MLDAIGPAYFLTLEGNFLPPAEEVDGPVVRKGVDGVALWLTGIRGKVSTLRSKVDTATIAHAHQAFRTYQAMQGMNPVTVIQHGVNMAKYGWMATVIQVRMVRAERILSCTGGVNWPSLGFLECEWDVIPIAIS